ncbi:hypothetical protein GF373_15575 [bacterium]|nr:hypothetical protein [bacterium]
MHRFHILLCVASLLTAVPCMSQNKAELFGAKVLYEAPGAVHGLAAGDFVPSRAGTKIACLLQPCQIALLDPVQGSAEIVFSGNDMVTDMHAQMDVGNLAGRVYPSILVSGTKQVSTIHHDGTQWQSNVVYDTSDFIGHLWSARVGDYDSRREGLEMFVIFENTMDTSLGVLLYWENQEWKQDDVYIAEVGMDTAAGDFDLTHPGSEFAITTEMGPTYVLHAPAEGWTPPPPGKDGSNQFGNIAWPHAKVWDNADDAGWVVKVADVLSTHEGMELVYGTRFSKKMMVSYPAGDGAHHVETLFQAPFDAMPVPVIPSGDPPALPATQDKFEDLAIGDVLPDMPGNEIVGVDSSGSVYLVWNENGEWKGEEIWSDSDALYAVLIEEIDTKSPGREILVGGETGIVTVLSKATLSHVPRWNVY